MQKSKIAGETIFAPQYIDYDISIDFMNLLIDVFGDAAESVFDAIESVSERDKIIPKDFTPYFNLYSTSPFASELILNQDSVNFYNVVTKPHSNNHRTRFRPLIGLTIDDDKYLISSIWLIFEAYFELCCNRLPFHGLPKSWLKFDKVKLFADEISNLVGDRFEEFVGNKFFK